MIDAVNVDLMIDNVKVGQVNLSNDVFYVTININQ